MRLAESARARGTAREDKRDNWLASGETRLISIELMKLLREKVSPNFSTVTKATRWNPTLKDKNLIML